MLPRVVRIRRRGGRILKGCDCYIGRAVKKGKWNLDASIWANPFQRNPRLPAGSTLQAYERYVRANPILMHEIPLLAGKTLGCWCNPCHGDVLVKLVQEQNGRVWGGAWHRWRRQLDEWRFWTVWVSTVEKASICVNRGCYNWNNSHKTTPCVCYGNLFRWKVGSTTSLIWDCELWPLG